MYWPEHLTIYGVARQDYLWALAAMLWGGVAVVEWRQRMQAQRSSWLYWIAGSCLGVSITECAMLYVVVEPIRDEPAPHLWGDVLQGVSLCLVVGGWAQTLTARSLLVCAAWFSAILVGASRWWFPYEGSLALALAATSLAVSLWMHARSWWLERLLLVGCALLPLSAPNGIIAYHLHETRRWMEVSRWGAVSSILFSLTAAIAAWVQSQSRLDESDAARRENKRELYAVWGLATLWIGVGFVLASAIGDLARRDFEQGVLLRLRATAQLMDSSAVERALGADFTLTRKEAMLQMSGRETNFAFSTWQQGEAGGAVRAMLKRVWEAIPEARAVFLRVHKDGEMLLCLAPWPEAEQWGWVVFDGKMEGREATEWNQSTGYFQGMTVRSFDEISLARWPMPDTNGGTIAWIEVHIGVSSWLAHQARARGLALTIVGLGLIVLLLWHLQRKKERGKQAAHRAVILAQASERAKATFLARASHELRTPLQAILGFGELLEPEVSTSRGRDYLRSIRSQGDLLRRLLGDLLDLGASEAGQLKLDLRPLELKSWLLSVAEMFQPSASSKGLGYTLDAEHLPSNTWALADATRLQQVVTNLVGNAVKYTVKGEVKIEAQCSRLSDNCVILRIEVSDTGPGISSHNQAKLFHPFQRLDAARSVEGAGLGLSIAFSLCTAMGGGLTVRSDGLSGSTFTVRVALTSCAEPVINSLQTGQDKNAKKNVALRVLIADDHPLIREFFSVSLTRAGMTCRSVSSGRVAWEELCSGFWDAAVLDLELPEIGGMEIATRARRRKMKIRLVAASAAARAEDASAAIAAGFDVHLGKPVTAEVLVDAVCSLSEWSKVGAVVEAGELATASNHLAEEIRSELEELTRAAKREDWDGLRQRLHYLRGGALISNSLQLAEALGSVENVIADGGDARVIYSSWERCHLELVDYIGAQPTAQNLITGPQEIHGQN